MLAAYDAAHKGPPGGARKLMENAPAVDATPVVHGHWIRHETEDGNFSGYDCSECGIWIIFGASQGRARFCPDCGARMDDSPACGSDYCEIEGDGHG